MVHWRQEDFTLQPISMTIQSSFMGLDSCLEDFFFLLIFSNHVSNCFEPQPRAEFNNIVRLKVEMPILVNSKKKKKLNKSSVNRKIELLRNSLKQELQVQSSISESTFSVGRQQSTTLRNV
jgi:hypothetical protein